VNLALDTNAYTALHRGDRALAEHVRSAATIGVPVIVLGELYFGFMNGERLNENDAALDRFLATPRVRVLHLTERTPRLFGEIATLLRRSGTPIQQDDVWIAALCKEHGFALATRDRGMRNVLGLRTVEF
jgi:tRNA(fMet)-specific endonuclease VapC